MRRKLTYNDKYWKFAREVLLEIKKQEKNKYNKYIRNDGIAYNVGLLLHKDIAIEELGKY